MNEIGYALRVGTGTLIIPSPNKDIEDLVLPPDTWVPVDSIFLKNHYYRKAKQDGLFEYKEFEDVPVNPDRGIKPELDIQLDFSQRQMVKTICSSPLTNQLEDILNITFQVNESGIPRNDSKVTTTYLREHHRPFLQAIEDLEKRWQKRKNVLALVKRNLNRIESLPG